jgi:hypothetical protein
LRVPDRPALVGPPAHAHRITAADRAAPDNVPPALPEPRPAEPVPRLVDARGIRRDLASYRQPCQYCQAAIVWAVNPRGDPVPIDADPHQQGYLWVTVTAQGPVASRLTAGQAAGAREHGHRLHRPHRESCPKRRLWSHVKH